MQAEVRICPKRKSTSWDKPKNNEMKKKVSPTLKKQRKGLVEDKKDFEDFLKALNNNLVEYCIVGAYAVGYHAKPRYTKDIDILVRDTKDNARKLLKAIQDFGFASLDLKVDDLMTKDTIIQLGYEPNRIDILTSIAGVGFEEAWANKRVGKFGRVDAYFIGLQELIKAKTASKECRERPEDIYKDMHDIEALNRVKEKINIKEKEL